MTKSHPKYITTAANRFLNDSDRPTHRIYGYGEDGRLYMSNGNAIYIGEPIDGLPPEYKENCTEMLQRFIDQWESQVGYDGHTLFADEVRESKKRQKEVGVAFPVWRMALPDTRDIGFTCDRLLRACDLLGKRNVTIALPSTPFLPAKLESPRGIVYQLPVRL